MTIEAKPIGAIAVIAVDIIAAQRRAAIILFFDDIIEVR